MPDMQLPPPPRTSAGYAPLRRPGSVRRTSSIDVSWPEGRTGNMRFDGRARDVVTSRSGGAPATCAEDSFVASVQWDRTIAAIEADPPRADIDRLVGERGGGHLRHVLGEVVPAERKGATPLYLILDDISGTSLIAGWAWSQWSPDWMEMAKRARAQGGFNMEGVCIGFRPGSSALRIDPSKMAQKEAPTPDLRHPDDPQGWHDFTTQREAGMRRARRIDVWRDEVIRIDAAFQDSGTTPKGGRLVLHEYQLTATADPDSLRVRSIEAHPRVLPFPECPSAVSNLTRLIDAPLAELRERVLTELSGTAGCTHLNDALRALAEVPALVRHLQSLGA